MPTLYFLCGSLGCALLSSRWGELALITDCFLLPLSRLITASPYLCGDLIEATRFRESVTGGAEKKKPTARFASGGGLETFSSLLAVSPRAGSGNSLLSRSRGNRHARLGGNSLGGYGHHSEGEDTTHGDESEEKVWGVRQQNAAFEKKVRDCSLPTVLYTAGGLKHGQSHPCSSFSYCTVSSSILAPGTDSPRFAL